MAAQNKKRRTLKLPLTWLLVLGFFVEFVSSMEKEEMEMKKVYAGIGSRGLLYQEREFCSEIGKWLARNGWKLKTGAAKGADQSFANGALSVGGKVKLCLPWMSYERSWVGRAGLDGATTKLLQYYHTEAMDSVKKYHPKPEALSSAMKSLHARNYLIIEDVKFVLAWPKGSRGGGTGQGIRIAKDLGIDVIDLSTKEGYDRVYKVVCA